MIGCAMVGTYSLLAQRQPPHMPYGRPDVLSKSLLAHAILGRDAQDFLNTELGRYIVGCCEQEKSEALEHLARVAPWRRNRIRQLQNEVWRAESVISWLGELITSGTQAEAVMDETD